MVPGFSFFASLKKCHNVAETCVWELHIAFFENSRSLATDKNGAIYTLLHQLLKSE